MSEVELTKEEQEQALAVALKLKQDTLKAEEDARKAEARAKAEEAEATRKAKEEARQRKIAPGKFVGVLLEGLVEPVYYPNAAPVNERTIALGEGSGRATYEHVSEDADGVWLYRHLG